MMKSGRENFDSYAHTRACWTISKNLTDKDRESLRHSATFEVEFYCLIHIAQMYKKGEKTIDQTSSDQFKKKE